VTGLKLRGIVLSRVVLFMIGCAVILAATSPIGSKLPGKFPEIVTGTLASLGAFGLTVLFVRLFGLWFAQIFVAAVFAAEHKLGGLSGTRAIVGAAVGSLLFGTAALATRGLAVPIGVHAAWNFGQWALGLRGGPAPWMPVVRDGSQESVDLAGTIIYLAVFASATLAFWLWRRKNDRQIFDRR